ncbi:MAG: hypothetical protein ACKVOB_01500 [Sphingomonas sp.]
MIDHYDWANGREAMLRFGQRSGPVVVMALPLFEEANRTRAFAVTMLRALAREGIAGALPDFPGTGESLEPTETLDIIRARDAFDGVVDHLGHDHPGIFGASIRSGALLDPSGVLDGRWQLAPQDGASLLRDLTRVKQLRLGSPLPDRWFYTGSDALSEDAAPKPAEIAGNMVSPDFLNLLSGYTPADPGAIPLRVVRLMTDPAPADHRVSGTALWRRAEPGNDLGLAALLATDITTWVRACAG